MNAKLDVCLQMRLMDQSERDVPLMEFTLEKHEDIPEGYPSEGMTIQVFHDEGPMLVSGANLWRNTEGKLEMHISGFWSCSYRTTIQMLGHIEKLKAQGWKVTDEHIPTKTDA